MWSFQPPEKKFVVFEEDYESDSDDDYSPVVPAWRASAAAKPAELDELSAKWVAQNIDPTQAKLSALPPIARTAKDIINVLKQKIAIGTKPGITKSSSFPKNNPVSGMRRARSEVFERRLPRLQNVVGMVRQQSLPPPRPQQQQPLPPAPPPPPPPLQKPIYQSKYSPELVEMLRDFYKEIRADGTLENQQRAFAAAMQKKQYKGLDTIAFHNLLDGSGRLTFKTLVRRIFPLANTRDVTSMILWAFPPDRKDSPPKELTAKERAELIELFKMWDTDGNLIITFDEFGRGMKDLRLPKADLLGIFQQLDRDKDGVLSLEEFIEGMHMTYF